MGLFKSISNFAGGLGLGNIGKPAATGLFGSGAIGGAYGANFWDPLDLSGSTARQYQAEQAQADREWQERMSNTAHQREVADLRAAGLNPVLSPTGGNGASTPGGAMAGNAVGAGIGDLVGLLQAFNTMKANKTTAKQVDSDISLNATQEDNIRNEINTRNARTAQDIAESQARTGKTLEETRIAQVEADRKALEYAKDRPILESEKRYNETAVAEFGVQAERLYEQYGKWADLVIKAFGVAGGLKMLGALKANGITKIGSFQQLEKELGAITRTQGIIKPF